MLQNRFAQVDGEHFDEQAAFNCFLMDAERLRQIGRKFTPSYKTAKPLLDGDEWRVPDDWAYPTQQPNWPDIHRIPIQPLPEGIENLLNKRGRPKK